MLQMPLTPRTDRLPCTISCKFVHLYIALTIVTTYCADAQLFVNAEVIYSREGTNQEDPLAMAMYAISTQSHIHKLNELNQARKVWFVDDAIAGGQLHLENIGPILGIMPMLQNHGSLSRRNTISFQLTWPKYSDLIYCATLLAQYVTAFAKEKHAARAAIFFKG